MTKLIACCIVVFGIAAGVAVGITHGVQEGIITGALAWLMFGGIETAYVLFTNRIKK
jgi:hypothetical protein